MPSEQPTDSPRGLGQVLGDRLQPSHSPAEIVHVSSAADAPQAFQATPAGPGLGQLVPALTTTEDTAMTTDTDPEILFARSPLGGKKTSELKFRTTDEVEAAVLARAGALGMTKSEWLERGVLVLLFGEDHVNSLEAQRTAAVAGAWHKQAASFGGV